MSSPNQKQIVYSRNKTQIYMKNLDKFSQRILAIGASLTMVILAATLFLQSTPFAKANAFPAELNAETIDKMNADGIQAVGKYQMQYQMIYDPEDRDYAHFVLVYDSETGNSRMYYRDGSSYAPSSGQLPSSPL